MPKQVDHRARKQELARAAFKAIAKHGWLGVTLAKVGREAGWSTGVVTYYVKSKDQLLLMATEHMGERGWHRLRLIEKHYQGLEALRQVLYKALPMDEEGKGIYRVWLGLCERAEKNKKIRPFVYGRLDGYASIFSRFIEDAKARKEIPADIDVVKTARAAIMMTDGIGTFALVSRQGLTAREQQACVDDWIASTLRPLQVAKSK